MQRTPGGRPWDDSAVAYVRNVTVTKGETMLLTSPTAFR
jgi:hypothetical protein